MYAKCSENSVAMLQHHSVKTQIAKLKSKGNSNHKNGLCEHCNQHGAGIYVERQPACIQHHHQQLKSLVSRNETVISNLNFIIVATTHTKCTTMQWDAMWRDEEKSSSLGNERNKMRSNNENHWTCFVSYFVT